MDKIKLIDYLPPFMQQFAEIKEIMRVEDRELEGIDANVQRVLDNGFIEDCNEYGIQKYEHILNIIPDEGDTLELRRARVLIEWNSSIPYTYRALIRKLNAICGVNNYSVSGSLEDYELIISTKLEVQGQTKEVEILLMKMLPENIAVAIYNELSRKIEGKEIVAGAIVNNKTVSISSDAKNVNVLNSKIIYGSVVASRIWRSIN